MAKKHEAEARQRDEPTLLVCTGSHCRKALARKPEIRKRLGRLPVPVRFVRCQKICDGPVVGVARGGALDWFREMRSEKAWNALAELVEGGDVARPLRKRECRKRAGRLRD